MKKMSLQWRLTCIITLYIAVICGCVTMLVYKNGVYYMDSLQEAVDTHGEMISRTMRRKYISAFRRTSGMSSPMTFLSRCIIIRRTTGKTA